MSHEPALPTGAIGVEAVSMTMRFGDFTALDAVTINIRPGTFHALLGENGAGKSTLVKCIMGFYHATSGGVLVDGHDARIKDPVDAQKLGLGMVYQHFTLVPSLTGAENLVISRADAPGVIPWRQERARLDGFLDRMPFRVPLDQPVNRLSAGEKQKLEILKQLYLGSRFLILDEPTSVLTPAEADEVLGHVRGLCSAGQISVLMISHKFREVTQFADDVSVLRRGKLAGGGAVSDLTHADMARMMMGEETERRELSRTLTNGETVLALHAVQASDRSGLKSIAIDDLQVRAGEILGVAGVSGNGQTELMEILTGQRRLTGGTISVKDAPYHATRREARDLRVRYLPEEPLYNACAPRMSVAENLAFRLFDIGTDGKPRIWKNSRAILDNAASRIAEFKVKTTSPHSPISALSGGNVQRAVLARELTGDVDLLVVANPCFGLDFAAVAAIRDRLIEARNSGVAVLLISEDLDEILELSDRIVVMSEGRIAFETSAAAANTAEIGSYMAGHA
ncbi:ABC transporter ATP-binding protein [Seohaeicola saemankumensis]|nr:ABC transporter ATP-binding protein [Seohaeicola saemankumensis]MCA0869603.1 ABC transporter ATP-binding protein [Seohaeicola saemankumensis]